MKLPQCPKHEASVAALTSKNGGLMVYQISRTIICTSALKLTQFLLNGSTSLSNETTETYTICISAAELMNSVWRKGI